MICRMRWLLLFLISFVVADIPYRSLQQWLSLITIDIPFIQVPFKLGYTVGTMNITHMMCNNLNLPDLNSTLVMPSTLHLHLGGVAAKCHGNYTMYNPHVALGGTMHIGLADVSLNFGIDLTPKFISDYNMTMFDSAQLLEANLNLNFTEFYFVGDGIPQDDNMAIIFTKNKDILIKQAETSIATILNVTLRDLIDFNLTSTLKSIEPELGIIHGPDCAFPPALGPVAPDSIAKLGLSPIINLLEYLSVDVLQRYLNGIMHDMDGYLMLENLNVQIPISGIANMNMKIIKLDIGGLDTWGSFDLFRALDNTTLEATTSLEWFNVSLRMGITIVGDGLVTGPSLYEEFDFELQLKNNLFMMATTAWIYGDIVSNYQLNQFLNTNCLLKMLERFNISALYLSAELLKFNLTSLNGGALESMVDSLIRNLVNMLIQPFRDGTLPAGFHLLVTEPLRNYVNNWMLSHLNDTSSLACPAAITPEIPNTNYFVNIIVAASVGGIAAILFLFMYCCDGHSSDNCYTNCVDCLENNDDAKSTYERGPEEPLVLKDAENDTSNDDSLLFHRNLSFFTRYIMLTVMILNFGLFLSAHTSAGATVVAILSENGTSGSLKLPPIFSLSLASSVKDMWDAGTYFLSILILLLSGVWPYMKLTLMAMCWIVPGYYISCSKREEILIFMDALGKWSLIDAFVLVLMMVAFRLKLIEPHSNGNPFTQVDILVEPGWGFHGFLIGTILSLTTNHILLHLHRRATDPPKIVDAVQQADKQTLANHLFVYRDDFSEKVMKVRMPYFSQVLVAIILAFALILTMIGASLISFQFEFRGLISVVLNYIDQPVVNAYSMLTAGALFPDASIAPNSIAIRWIQVFYYIFVFGVPVTHVIMMIVLWVTPLNLKMQRDIFLACEVLNAWASVEVFIVGIVASCLQVPQFAGYLIGDKCDFINGTLKKYFDHQLHSYDTCFEVTATLDEGAWTLFSSCLLLIVSRNAVMSACHRALKEQNNQIVDINSNSTLSPAGNSTTPGTAHSSTRNFRAGSANAIDGLSLSNYQAQVYRFFAKCRFVDIEESDF